MDPRTNGAGEVVTDRQDFKENKNRNIRKRQERRKRNQRGLGWCLLGEGGSVYYRLGGEREDYRALKTLD